jgi:Tol biopolymer transport system component/DNA-binding winged helix-turn-helix (wHTH) protein
VSDRKLRFDGWIFDPESGDLEHGGVRIRLQEQSTLVLKELIAHSGSVVTREQLIALLWPKGIVDFDTGLNTTIRKLRSALADEAESPRYIETLPRRGYRFVGTLDAAPEAPGAAAPPVPATTVPAPPAARQNSRARPALRGWLGPAAAVLVIALAALWFVSAARHAWRDPLANARFVRLTDLPGQEQAAAISRDGRWVAFLADRDGQTDAWLTQVGSGRYRNLTEGREPGMINPLVRNLGFSADGSLITIWARRSDGSRPADINILAAPTAGGALQPYMREAAEVAWSGDGKRIVYHTSAPGDPMFVKDAAQATARRLYTAPAGVHCHFPVWSPDEAFIYFARGVPPDAWDIWRIRPDGTDLERITFHNSLVIYPVLLDTRTLLYLAADAEGRGPRLYALDLTERVPHRLSFGLERYTSLAASADGSRLVATVANSTTSLWSVSIAGDAGVNTSAVPLAADTASGFSPRLGPNYLLYVSSAGGRWSLHRLAAGAGRELWSDARAEITGAPAISPDGRRIAFTAAAGGHTRLIVMPSDGGEARVVSDSLVLRGSPAWTPDGQAIVSAVMQDGEPRLTTLPLNGGAPLTLVAEYSLDPSWSPDGQFLLYSGADLGTTFPLRAVGRDGRPYGLTTLVLTRGARRVVFAREGTAIVVLRGEIGHKNFWLVDLKSGVERQLTDLPPDFMIRDFDVSADGTRIVFDRTEEDSHIALIERSR